MWHNFHHCNLSELTYIDGLAQDCNNSIANSLELLQSCNKHANPSVYIGLTFSHSYKQLARVSFIIANNIFDYIIQVEVSHGNKLEEEKCAELAIKSRQTGKASCNVQT